MSAIVLKKTDMGPFIMAIKEAGEEATRLTEVFAKFKTLDMAKFKTLDMEERCLFSELFPSECAHCLGHVPDWDEAKPKVNLFR